MKSSVYVTVLFCLAAGSLFGCGSDGEQCDDPTAKLFVTSQPRDGIAEANGNDVITVKVTGQDEKCNPIAEDAVVEFTLSRQDPEGVGMFSNDSDEIEMPYGRFGAAAEVSSSTVGTALVRVFVGGEYNLSGEAPVEFITPSVGDQCGVEISAVPPVIIADGESTTTVTATLTADKGGTMPDGTAVTFTTTRGKFTESGGQNYETSSTDSAATATLQSEASADPVDVEVTVTFTCDDNKLHSNTESVRFGPVDEPLIDLRSSKSTVLADDVDLSDLTAEVFMPGGQPAPEGVMVNFYTELGRFQESGSGSYDGPTDAEGIAHATFIGGTTGGTAEVRASAYIEGQTASDTVNINIRALGNVRWESSDPEKLGVKGSGRDESSNIIFKLLDTEDRPFPAGALVEFEHSAAPGVTLDPLSARTDANGQVRTTLNSGTVATTVTVTATAHVGSQLLSADSPSIAIVGAKPNAKYLTFSCELFNVGGFILDFVETRCHISLADRYTNKIGFATQVTFATEAGSITGSAITDDDGVSMGMAQTTIRTGNPRPVDVTPIPGEPFVNSRNPRDGLVTIMAFTSGEEAFSDVNGNGRYDVGEPFEDLPEPFVDTNDNQEYDAQDKNLVDINENGVWDGPNGVWDSDTQIWVEVRMLWTGHVQTGGDCNSAYRFSSLCQTGCYDQFGNPVTPAPGPDTFDAPKGGHCDFEWRVTDINLNPPNETLRVDVMVDGKGSLGASSPPLSFDAPDTLGYEYDPETDSWGFTGGFLGTVVVNGAPSTNTTGPQTGTVTVEASYKESPGEGVSVETTIPVSGTFQ